MKKNVDVLLGLQWGDEGKGAFIDRLTIDYDIVARFQGGPNAGHTLEFDGQKHVLHLIPSGIFRDDIMNVIGNGVVIEPVIFRKEILDIHSKFSIDVASRLILSNKAKLILPTHRLLDAANEFVKGKDKIGSTGKGIGPCYQDDKARIGLRVGDIFKPDFKEKYLKLKDIHMSLLLNHFNFPSEKHVIDNEKLSVYEENWFRGIDVLKSFKIEETEYYLNQAIDVDKKILVEGAQGTLLDVEFGTYPMVTSSNVVSGGVCTGLGIGPNKIGDVIGIFKAYTTRVGNGPFPTELFDGEKLLDVEGKTMHEVGKEFGATTGRIRRCGWLDLPALKYACMVNGVTKLYMTKADVLSLNNGFDRVKVAVGYQLKNHTNLFEFRPDSLDEIDSIIYKEFQSWPKLAGSYYPNELQDYVKSIEEETGIKIEMISIGPDRTEVLNLNK